MFLELHDELASKNNRHLAFSLTNSKDRVFGGDLCGVVVNVITFTFGLMLM